MGESTPEQRDGEPCLSCGELMRWHEEPEPEPGYCDACARPMRWVRGWLVCAHCDHLGSWDDRRR